MYRTPTAWVATLAIAAAGAMHAAVASGAAGCVAEDWRPSRHPAGYKFAFTIVHDADAAYSERLAPLFEVFDELGLRITVTVFAFWADWARDGAVWSRWTASPDDSQKFFAPRGVPLADERERQFYRRLAERGHEIGLHSATDSSDTRDQLVRAFAYFKEVFGHSLGVYVEHSMRHNREAQGTEGADPASPYYCTDVLNRYGPWVWVDGEHALPERGDEKFYEIPPEGTPFSAFAAQRYGIRKGFIRTGKWTLADGDGFLEAYSEKNIDALENDGGTALVYMHLDSKWLDPHTRKMREPLKNRLRYLAAKAGWFVPAGQILDRARAVEGIRLACNGDVLQVENRSGERVDRLTITARRGGMHAGRSIVIESIGPSDTLSFDLKAVP